MKVTISLSLNIRRREKPASEPEQHYHPDTESYVEHAAPHRLLGFVPKENYDRR